MTDPPNTVQERFDDLAWPEPMSGCWLWGGDISTDGYGTFWMGKSVRAHRASWELHRGPIPEGMWVLHRWDNRACVNPDHLFLGTHRNNMDDMARKGRAPRGERNGMTKLTEVQALEILSSTERSGLLAQRFGVSSECVRRIRARESWVHLAKR